MYIYFDANLSFDVSRSVCSIVGSTSRTGQLHLVIMYSQVIRRVIVPQTLVGHRKDGTLFASKQYDHIRQDHPSSDWRFRQ
jgi:hypothetical protein